MSLRAQNISLRGKDGAALLTDVNLSLEPGETLAILGQNGAGKSTFLRTLAGELSPSKGEIVLEDRELSSWPDEHRARLLAVLPQKSHLNFAFKAQEIVAFGRYPHQTGYEQDQQLITQALKFVDAWHLRERDYSQLSGGEQQRVQLARVLVQIWQPVSLGHRYLLLDEPTTGLDLHHQESLFKQVRQFARQGIGVLFITHDLNLAARYADRIVMIECGMIVGQGKARELLTPERISMHFGLEVQVIDHPKTGSPQFLVL